MPYYCTVPRCTSMAGKAKNVSFHQFPRDEELAELWNNILKRGKPYTKYSKVCSLHFRPEDYTITSAGKNKGQWRTLRKDAIPSQNLPSDSPAPYRKRQSEGWLPNNVQLEPQLQMAQALYVQMMIAMQAAGFTDASQINTSSCNGVQPQNDSDPDRSSPQTSSEQTSQNGIYNGNFTNTSYKCTECTKCFKDPDVFILHKRTHKDSTQKEKENFNFNSLKPEMLKSNPILANLLKNSMEKNVFENDTFQKQFMLSISNAENYLRSGPYSDPECDDLSDNLESNNLVIDENVA